MPIYNTWVVCRRIDAHGNEVELPAQAGLCALGPVFEVVISVPVTRAEQLKRAGQSVPAAVTGNAIIDTGASFTAIDAAVATQLGLPVVDVQTMHSASGPFQPEFDSCA
jgi:hypothetical protein